MPINSMSANLLSGIRGNNMIGNNPQPQPPQTPQVAKPAPVAALQPKQNTAPAVDTLGGPLGHALLGALKAATVGQVRKESQKPTDAAKGPWDVVDEMPVNFAHGNPALEGLEALAKVPTKVLALAEKYPVATKLIHAAIEKHLTAKDSAPTLPEGASHAIYKDGVHIGHAVNGEFVPNE